MCWWDCSCSIFSSEQVSSPEGLIRRKLCAVAPTPSRVVLSPGAKGRSQSSSFPTPPQGDSCHEFFLVYLTCSLSVFSQSVKAEGFVSAVIRQLKGNMPYQVMSNLVGLFVYFKYSEHRSMEQIVEFQREGRGGWVDGKRLNRWWNPGPRGGCGLEEVNWGKKGASVIPSTIKIKQTNNKSLQWTFLELILSTRHCAQGWRHEGKSRQWQSHLQTTLVNAGWEYPV